MYSWTWTSGRISGAVAVMICLSLPGSLAAKVVTVAADGTGDYKTISQAITASSAGDVIEVQPGSYSDSINFLGKAVRVIGVGGPEVTFITGSSLSTFSPVNFTTFEDADSSLEGFTITGGRGTRLNQVYYGGGIYILNSSPSLSNLVVRANNASYGGGIYCGLNTNPYIRDVRVEENTASASGGGIYVVNGAPTLENVKVAGNLANGSASNGGGIFANKCDGDFTNLLVVDNQATGQGGGVYLDAGSMTMRFSTVAGNFAGTSGGGLYVTANSPYPTLHSLIVASNAGDGVDLRAAGIPFTYTDVALNTPDDYARGSSGAGGTGNLSQDPLFLRYTNNGDFSDDDYHLQGGSPARNAGDPYSLDPDYSRADMGYYGGPAADLGTSEDQDGDGLPDQWENDNFGGLELGPDDDPDSDGLSNLEEYSYSTDPSEADSDADGVDDNTELDGGQDPLNPADNRPVAAISGSHQLEVGVKVVLDGAGSQDPNDDPLTFRWSFLSVPTQSGLSNADLQAEGETGVSFVPDVEGQYRVSLVVNDGIVDSAPAVFSVSSSASSYDVPGTFATIQAAIDAAPEGAVIEVQPGTYVESLDFQGKGVTVLGVGGPLLTELQAADESAVVFAAGEDDQTVLSGFTVTGGTGRRVASTSYGGGIYIEESSPILRDLIVIANTADQGAGLYIYGPAEPTIEACRIEENVASGFGGGFYVDGASPRILGSWILSNGINVSAGQGGGFYLTNASPVITNCLIAGNQAGSAGNAGGLMVTDGSSPLVTNNTVAYNRAGLSTSGGAVHIDASSGEFVNNIFAFSQAGYGLYTRAASGLVWRYNDVYGNTGGNYCTTACAAADPTGDDGNLSVEPMFVHFSDNGDYTDDSFVLQSESLLIDAGEPTLKDPDGSVSDMGAYGGPEADPTALYPDGDQDGMPDWWELTYGTDPLTADASADPDGDALSNAVEYASGTDPQKEDTDQDGVDDKEELDLGDDPTDGADQRPVALASADVNTLPGQKVTLDGRKSSDPNGDPLTFKWLLITAPTASTVTQGTLTGADQPQMSFTPDKPGLYMIHLVVNDGKVDSLADPVQVTVVQVIGVPGDYETIQQAIDAAQPGARVEVKAGTYEEVLDFKGKAITVMAADPSKETIVTAPRGGGSVVSFRSGEQSSSVLKGLTLSGGTGTLRGTTRFGGGVFMEGSSPTLLDLTLTDNKADYGAGIACRAGLSGGRPAPIVRRVMVSGNVASTSGGGYYADSCDAGLQASTYESNEVTEQDGGGGGLYLLNARGVIESNLILGNTSAGVGGGVLLDGASPQLVNNTLVGNDGVNAGGLSARQSTAVLKNNIVAFNKGGAGVSNEDVVLNLAIDHCLFYQNEKGNFGGMQADVLGKDGNLEGDPLFVAFTDDNRYTNDDFHLTSSSPAVNAGDEAIQDADGSRSDIGAYGGTGTQYMDLDGDGYSGDEGDCDPSDPRTYPGATELLDGEDNDCDGEVDEGGGETPTPTPDPEDQDGDGYPGGRRGTDCDDTNPNINPGATEIPDNGVDEDCDGCDGEVCATPTEEPETPTEEPETPTEVPETPTVAPTDAPTGTPTPAPEEPGCGSCSSQPVGADPGLSLVLLLAAGALFRRRR